MIRTALLVCGIVASVLYVAADLLAAVFYPEYQNFTSRTISELSALGAPSRPLVLPILSIDSVLVLAFAIGVWASAGSNRALRATGIMLVGLGVTDLMAPFFPMHARGSAVGTGFTDAMHIAVTSANVLFILLATACSVAAFGKRFRWYAIASLAVIVVFGAVAGSDGPRIAANLETPWAGLTERICIGAYLLWQAVLAVALLIGANRAAERLTGQSGPRSDRPITRSAA